jgi:hypothetical protein
MALNQSTYHVKGVKTGAFNIVTGTTVNTNLDGTGALNLITNLGSATALSVTDKGQVREIRVSLNGNLATATSVRFFKSTSSTAPTASNTVFLFDVLLPATTFTTTTSYSPTVLTFAPNQFQLGPNEFLFCAVSSPITNGADVIVILETFDE